MIDLYDNCKHITNSTKLSDVSLLFSDLTLLRTNRVSDHGLVSR